MITKSTNRALTHLFGLAVLILLVSNLAPIQAQEVTDATLYDPAHITEVAIEIAENDWKELCAQTRDPGKVFAGKVEDPFSYFKADITIDGQQIKSVGVRKKGFIGSLDDHFPSLKVKFNEYEEQQPIANVDVLTLNNNKQDASLLSQFMAYKLFNTVDVRAPRSSFARVTVNGEYLGLYSNVESIGKPFLQRRFGDGKGNLYEGTLADFYPRALHRLEVKSNKKKHDDTRIRRLATTLAAKGDLDVDAVGQLVDIDNFLRYWAMESLIGFWDGYCNNQNNYWVYQNPADGKLYFMPWGADAAFMSGGFPGFGPRGPVSVYVESMLANRLYREEVIATRYKEVMQSQLKEVWKVDELTATIDKMEKHLTPHLHARQMGAPRAMDSMRQFIKRRQKAIETEMQNWPVNAPSAPRKPMYVLNVGKAAGSFKTNWSDRPPKDIAATGHIDLKLELDGQPVQLEKSGATVNPPPRGGFPGFGGPFQQMKPSGNIILAGIKADNSARFQLTLSIPLDVLEKSAGKTIEVDGMFTDDMREGAPFNPFGGKTVTGTLKLDKVGFKPDETIEGQYDLTIAQVHGGFFNREQR